MQLVLYTTDYCQLCEEAEDLIYRELSGYQYVLKKIDVSDTDELMAHYGLRIPVLSAVHNESVELDWPFDAHQLLVFINQVGLGDGAV